MSSPTSTPTAAAPTTASSAAAAQVADPKPKAVLRLPERAFQAPSQTLPASSAGYPAPSPQSTPLFTPMNASTVACPDAPTKRFPPMYPDTGSLDPTPTNGPSPSGLMTPANIWPSFPGFSGTSSRSSSSLGSFPEVSVAPAAALRLPEKALQAPSHSFASFPAPSPQSRPLCTPMNASTHAVCPNAPERRNFHGTDSLDPTPMSETPMSVMTPANMWPMSRTSSSVSGGSDARAPADIQRKPALRLPEGVFQAFNQTMAAFPAPSPQSQPIVTPMNASTHAVCPSAPERRNFRSQGSLDPTPTVTPSPASVMTPANMWPTDQSSSCTPMSGQAWPAPHFQLGSGLTAQMFGSQSSLVSGDITPIAAGGNSGSTRRSNSESLEWLAPILNERTPVAGDDTPMSFQHSVSNSSLNNARILDSPPCSAAPTPSNGELSKKSSASSLRTPMDQQPLGFFPNESMPDNGPSMCFRNSGA